MRRLPIRKAIYNCENIYLEIASMFREISNSEMFDFNVPEDEITIKISTMDRYMIEQYIYEKLRRSDGQFTYRGEFYDYTQMYNMIKDKCYIIDINVPKEV